MIGLHDWMNERGVSSAVGVILMVAVVIILAGVFAGVSFTEPNQPPTSVVFEPKPTTTNDGAELVLVHTGGESVSGECVSVEGLKNTSVPDNIEAGDKISGELTDSSKVRVVHTCGKGTSTTISKTLVDPGWNTTDGDDGTNNGGTDGGATVVHNTAPTNCAEDAVYEGDGTAGNPYKVDSDYDLQCMSEEPGAVYELTTDIDASGTETWNGGDGFEPIKSPADAFTGTVDGNNHEVTGLTINITVKRSNSEFVGMFGGLTGEIRNLKLTDASVTENITYDGDVLSSGDYTAILVGANGGSIKNVHVGGDVEGLVGVASITAYNSGAGTISQTTTDVKMTGEAGFAGLVAENYGTVTNSAAHGTYTQINNPTQSAGGSSGAGAVAVNKGTVEKTYSTAEIVVTDYKSGAGGLIGVNQATVTDSYWDTEASGMSSSDGGTGLTTSEMTGSTAESNMGGFDFGAIWETVPGNYPELTSSSG